MPRPGLPQPATVVGETMVSPVALAAESVRAARSPFRILHTTEVDAYDEPVEVAEVERSLAPEAAPGLALEAAPGGENYRGKARKAAKISIADATKVEEFADLKDLVASLVPDEQMREHEPVIQTTPDSGRVEEENRNVRVQTFLYAASRENDNDYHLILGRDPQRVENDPDEALYMNMEISGLPPSSSPDFGQLKAARDAFKEYFGSNLPGASYQFYDPPRPVTVEGSLFFDMTHATGSRPGPQSLVDHIPTIWEVHPISSIEFHD